MTEHRTWAEQGVPVGRRVIVVAGLALIVPALVERASGTGTEAGGTPAATPSGVATPEGGATPIVGATPEGDATPVVGATLEAFDYGYRPVRLRVSIGETVALFSSGRQPHDFTIRGYVPEKVVLPTDGRTVYWTVPESIERGTHTFYCSVGPHRAMGMEGRLVVTR